MYLSISKKALICHRLKSFSTYFSLFLVQLKILNGVDVPHGVYPWAAAIVNDRETICGRCSSLVLFKVVLFRRYDHLRTAFDYVATLLRVSLNSTQFHNNNTFYSKLEKAPENQKNVSIMIGGVCYTIDGSSPFQSQKCFLFLF